MGAAMVDTVDEVGRVAAAEGIDCDYAKGGTVAFARTPRSCARARADGGLRVTARGRRRRCSAHAACSGASYTPACARIQPAKLVRGLARAVERAASRIFEAHGRQRGRATPGGDRPRRRHRAGTVGARHRGLDGAARARGSVVPVYSLMVATEPLPTRSGSGGLAGGQTFTDFRHLIVYGQRTADDRLVFGGRGARYHWRSRIAPEYDRDAARVRAPARGARDLFPALAPRPISRHAWGGPLGHPARLARGRRPRPPTASAWAGGYVGDGVGTSNLAGRTLRRARARPRRPGHPAALGGPPLAALGAGAAALAARQRGPAADGGRRRRRSASPGARA